MSKLAQIKALREAKAKKPRTAFEKISEGLTEILEDIQANKPQKIAEAKQAVTNITNTATLSPSERSLKWRTENPERYKETQRNLMRKKRGTKKDASGK